jgi:hypothetical protein
MIDSSLLQMYKLTGSDSADGLVLPQMAVKYFGRYMMYQVTGDVTAQHNFSSKNLFFTSFDLVSPKSNFYDF